MPYYTIDRCKVFLSHSRWMALNGSALAHKDPEFRIDSMIAGRPAAREADKLRFQHLTQLCMRDPDGFYREWVQFDFRDREAQDNAWDLLRDYCDLRRIGRLVDMRPESDVILADYAGDSFTYPMGRVFGLRVVGRQTLASWLRGMPGPMLTLIVDTSQIVSAFGTLEDFQLQFRHCVFQCSGHFIVVFTDVKTQRVTLA